MRTLWIAWQIGAAILWTGVVILGYRAAGLHSPGEIARPLIWAAVAALTHSLLGVRLIRTKSNRADPVNSGINGGLIVLVIRYLAGAGLFLSGMLAFPEQRAVFATGWSGLFLILLVSEMIVFSKGVNRL